MRQIPLAWPSISEGDIEAVGRVLRSGMLVQGQEVAAFEAEVAAYLGIKHVIAVSNGTASLHLALLAFGIGPEDEVIVPALSYVATANVVEIVGATCVFVDVEPDTFNIDVSLVPAAITNKTKAMIPVHEFGLPCNISELMPIAKQHGLYVIEDAACALGAQQNDRFVGTFGNVGSFSLHPRKAVTSGEGGLLTTDDDALAERFRILRNHGISSAGPNLEFVDAGLNYRMTEFQAALVRGQFSRIDEIISKRSKLASLYFENLGNVGGIHLPKVPSDMRHTWQTFHTVVDADRDDVITNLKLEGIGSNYGAQCIPSQSYYQTRYGLNCSRDFPNAVRAYKNGLALPIFEKLSENDVEYVAANLVTQLAQRIDRTA